MAKLTAKEIIDSLKEMNLLELKEVVDMMKEEFGVDPSAVAVAAAPAATAASDEPSTVTVVLAEVGANKIAVIKLIQGITGLGLKDAKDIADNLGTIKENVAKEEADKMKADFEAAGAKVNFK
jgi:large subunit ribosomal protein L7/L12